jgi:hypothetical protein
VTARLLVAGAGLIFFGVYARSARAAEPVEIAVIGTPLDLQRVRELLDPRRLGGAPPRWTRADRFDPREVLRAGTTLRCWVDLSDPRRSRLTFASRSGERFLVRDVGLSGRFDELDRQSLAQVLELSIAALLEDERAGLSRAEAQALLLPPVSVAEAPPSSSRPRSPSPLDPGVFYAAKVLGGELPVAHGPGVALDWLLGGDSRGLLAWLEGQLQLPVHARGDIIGLGLVTVAVRAGPGARWSVGTDTDTDADADRPMIRLRQIIARLGLGLDFVRLSPESGTAPASPRLAPDRWSQSLVVSGALGLGFRLGRRLRFEARLFADFLPTAVHYDVQTDGRVSPVFSPSRFRPGLALAMTLR